MRKVFIFSAILFVATALSLMWFGYRLSTAAQNVADGRSFCLQVPKNSPFRSGVEYQAASSWQDLTPLIMRGGNSLYHAVLVVDDGARFALYNWSYWSMSFRNDVPGRQDTAGWPIFCKAGYSLRGGPLGDRSQLVFLRDSTRWAAGKEYEPSAGYGDALLDFRAVEPDFRPLSAKEISPYGHAYWSIFIGTGDSEILRTRKWLESLLTSGIYRKPHHQVVAQRDQTGALIAVVACMPPTDKNPRSCQNRFIRDGMTFSFRHEPMPEEQWIKLQQALFGRLRSFERSR